MTTNEKTSGQIAYEAFLLDARRTDRIGVGEWVAVHPLIQGGWEAAASAVAAPLEARLAATQSTLENLLCVIHRDGGHHTAGVGLEKSAINAQAMHLAVMELAGKNEMEANHLYAENEAHQETIYKLRQRAEDAELVCWGLTHSTIMNACIYVTRKGRWVVPVAIGLCGGEEIDCGPTSAPCVLTDAARAALVAAREKEGKG